MKSIYSLTNSFGVFTEAYRYLQKSNNPDTSIEDLKRQWATSTLARLRVQLEVQGEVSEQKSILFVGNHISYLDIPLLMATVNRISFVAKHEIGNWPVFGTAAKKIETVFVKRENSTSRKSARKAIQEALDDGKRIAIFPSGTTCISEKTAWRHGGFEIAQEKDIYIQPFRLSYFPLRVAAYIDQDFFPTHLYNLFGLDRIEAKIEFHAPVKVTDAVRDCEYWHHWSREIVDGSRN
jgi:1-acyl-sn-glycerol-3-phosphate acyltransferase